MFLNQSIQCGARMVMGRPAKLRHAGSSPAHTSNRGAGLLAGPWCATPVMTVRFRRSAPMLASSNGRAPRFQRGDVGSNPAARSNSRVCRPVAGRRSPKPNTGVRFTTRLPCVLLLAARKPDFHSGKTGSIPVARTIFRQPGSASLLIPDGLLGEVAGL